jgi:hypothetical protein
MFVVVIGHSCQKFMLRGDGRKARDDKSEEGCNDESKTRTFQSTPPKSRRGRVATDYFAASVLDLLKVSSQKYSIISHFGRSSNTFSTF